MKYQRLHCIFALFVLLSVGIGVWAIAQEPAWIQSNERIIGANHPDGLDDTLNRAGKTIWQNVTSLSASVSSIQSDVSSLSTSMSSVQGNVSSLSTSMSSVQGDVSSLSTSVSTAQSDISSLSTSMSSVQSDVSSLESLFSVEHNADGTHDFSVPDPSEYALSGSGSGSLASASFSPTGLFTSGPFSIWGIVTFERLGVAESLLSSTSTEYSETIVNCYKDASNHLAAALGTNLYTSSLVVSDLNRPTEIGCTFTGSQVFFWLDGQTDSAQAASGAFPSVNLMEQIAIGNALQGDVLSVSVSGAAIRSASGWFTPYREGLSQCPECAMQYDMDEQSGSTLIDRAGSHHLTVSGSWQEYAAGY